jgi:hypothetical protein
MKGLSQKDSLIIFIIYSKHKKLPIKAFDGISFCFAALKSDSKILPEKK